MSIDEWDNLDDWGKDPRFPFSGDVEVNKICQYCGKEIDRLLWVKNSKWVCDSCWIEKHANERATTGVTSHIGIQRADNISTYNAQVGRPRVECFLCRRTYNSNMLIDTICSSCNWVERCRTCRRKVLLFREEIEVGYCRVCCSRIDVNKDVVTIHNNPPTALLNVSLIFLATEQLTSLQWKALLRYNQHHKEITLENQVSTDWKRCQIEIALKAFQALKKPCLLTISTDMAYLFGGIQKIIRRAIFNPMADNYDWWQEISSYISAHHVKLNYEDNVTAWYNKDSGRP